jgi:hypothetical protein
LCDCFRRRSCRALSVAEDLRDPPDLKDTHDARVPADRVEVTEYEKAEAMPMARAPHAAGERQSRSDRRFGIELHALAASPPESNQTECLIAA